MKRFFSRAAVAGLSAALVAGTALVAAPAASAAPIGTVTFNGLTTQTAAFSVTTSAACPVAATNFQIRITSISGNLTTPALITGNTVGTAVGGINAGAFTAGASNTLQNFAIANSVPGAAASGLGAGDYQIDVVCRTNTSGASLGEFVGTFRVASLTSAVPVVAPVNTTTTVTSATPAAGATNAPATFTASVSPVTAVGTVQFSVDGVALGTPVTVSGGTATSVATGLLAAGNRNVVASFVGGSGYNNSTSATFVYAVSGVTAASVTNLGLSAASVEYPNAVTATATVTSGGNPVTAGTVQFSVDGVALGAPVTVSITGVASVSISRSQQVPAYVVLAVFSGSAGSAGVAIIGSTSPSASFTVTAPAYTPDVQYIRTSIAPGTLVISTPYFAANPLVIPALVLNPTATEYSNSATFAGIQVTDTRPGNLPYTLSAVSSDLTKFGVAVPNNNEIINAQNVGLTALTLTSTNSTPATFLGGVALGGPTAGQNFTGFNNPAAAHVSASNVGTLGLGGTPKSVLHANSGLGTTVTAGTLTITAPTNTLDGTYNGTVTFTIIGS